MAGGFADCLPAWAQILLQRNQPALTAAPAPAEPEPPPPPFDPRLLTEGDLVYVRDSTDEEWWPATVDRVDASQGVRVQVQGWAKCAPGRGFVFKTIRPRVHDYSRVHVAAYPDAPPPLYAAAAAEAEAEDEHEGVPGSWGSDSEEEDEDASGEEKTAAWQPDPEVRARVRGYFGRLPDHALARRLNPSRN